MLGARVLLKYQGVRIYAFLKNDSYAIRATCTNEIAKP